jgi:hypothetical protein
MGRAAGKNCQRRGPARTIKLKRLQLRITGSRYSRAGIESPDQDIRSGAIMHNQVASTLSEYVASGKEAFADAVIGDDRVADYEIDRCAAAPGPPSSPSSVYITTAPPEPVDYCR